MIECHSHDQGGYRYATEAELASLWHEAGLREVTTGGVVVSSDYESFQDYWEPLAVPDGTPGHFLATLSPDVVRAIRDDLRRRVGDPPGPFRLNGRAWYVVGRA